MTRILVVDDHPLSRKYLRTVLHHAGYEVAEARDGAHALELLPTLRPDLIITDLHMPQLGGFEFIQRLRLMPEWSCLPVVFCTATYREEEARVLAQECDVDYVLPKPASPQRILEVTAALLPQAGLAPRPASRRAGDALALRMSTVIELGIDLLKQPDPHGMQTLLCNGLLSVVPCTMACSAVVEERGRLVSQFSCAGYEAVPRLKHGHVLPTRGAFAVLKGASHLEPLRDPALAAELMGLPPAVTPDSLLAVAVRRDGHLRGWVALCGRIDQPGFDEDDEAILATLSMHAAVAYENAYLHAQLQRQSQILQREVRARGAMQKQLARRADHDALTGLANPALLKDRLRQALAYARRYDESVYLVYIDLDGFKPINDTLGHDAGDKVLKEVAARLSVVMRDSDTVARKGGDEFVVVLTGIQKEDEAQAALHHLLEALSAPIRVKNHDCRVTASIGLSSFPADAEDPELLLQQADSAMYQAKQAGRNQVCRYHANLV